MLNFYILIEENDKNISNNEENDKILNNFWKQIKDGFEIELEHKKTIGEDSFETYLTVLSIAMDHLKENDKYYKILKKEKL